MATFSEAIQNQSVRTTNGMMAYASAGNACVTLFFKIGASRGKNIIPDFAAAYAEHPEAALRIVAWARDIRGGAGERQLFRDVVNYLANANSVDAKRLLSKAPEWGRWDDVLVLGSEHGVLKEHAYNMISNALDSGNGLCAKWMPRKGVVANRLRKFLGWTPKFYRKRLVELTKVVETQMCAKQWDEINFSHVPSVASARYKKAFNRNTPEYGKYVAALVKGDTPEVKVNAGAVYPYDVLKGYATYSLGGYSRNRNYDETERNHMIAQWNALENFIGEAKILPLVDVSGSMTCPAGQDAKSNLTCLDVAVSLGLYCADKNTGPFNGAMLTFSRQPELVMLKGDVLQKVDQMVHTNWGMNTDIDAALQTIVKVAVSNNVPQEDMPAMLIVFSDMQFDCCAGRNQSAIERTRQLYIAAGYKIPQVVFWNINARSNVPVKYDESGVALVSGFAPALIKNLLSADVDQFTPESIMAETIFVDRYNL